MTKEKNNEDKTCLFFASDYHFEMITIPYIKQTLAENKDIVVMTQNDLKDTVYKVIENINFEENTKKDLKKIDWNNNDLEKKEIIKKAKQDNKEIVVFIKGNEDYIEKINNEIQDEIKTINCYDINEVGDNMKNIISQYNKILSTSGIEKLL